MGVNGSDASCMRIAKRMSSYFLEIDEHLHIKGYCEFHLVRDGLRAEECRILFDSLSYFYKHHGCDISRKEDVSNNETYGWIVIRKRNIQKDRTHQTLRMMIFFMVLGYITYAYL